MKPKLVGALAFLTLLMPPRPTMEPQWSDWPLERVIANLEARAYRAAAGGPTESEALYNLGRAHAFAFVLQRNSLRAGEDLSGDLHVEDWEGQEKFALSYPSMIDPRQRLDHLVQGVRHLRSLCSIEEPDTWWNARKHLTHAWLLEMGAHLADRVDTLALFNLERMPEMSDSQAGELRGWIADLGTEDTPKAESAQRALAAPKNLEWSLPLLIPEIASSNRLRQRAAVALLQRYWIERSIAEYWRASEIAYPSETEGGRVSFESGKGVESLVSYEALGAFQRLVQQRGVQGPEESKRMAKAAEQWLALPDMPVRSVWITPIVLSLYGCKTVDEIITPHLTVPFDLDGDGVDELWPWIAPDAGWLVWDPRHRGEITSGRQLFGSASAWLFFEDGYRVLDALDDDRDGELRGGELAGISVWFDRDTDGVSDRGEVVPVDELGIVALRTQATIQIGASPANLCGLEMSDGRVLPTYDWVLAPIEMP